MAGDNYQPLRPEENGARNIAHDGEENDSDFQSREGSDNEQNEMKEEDQKKMPQTPSTVLLKMLVCLLVGVISGFLLEKSRVFEPINIRGQMVFKRMTFLKVMLSAVSAGMFCLSLLAMISSSQRSFQRVCISFYSQLSDHGIMACCLGGWLVGIGMTLSGSDPVYAFVQLGVGLPNIEYTIGGVFLGTLIYGLMFPVLKSFVQPFFRSSANPWIDSAYFATALPLVVMFAMLVFAFELLVPWYSENKSKEDAKASILNQKTWPPHLCGALLGFIQLPLVMGAAECLGGSSTYATLLSQVFVGPLRRISQYLSRYRYGISNWAQVLFCIGLVLGGYLSASASGNLGTSKGVFHVPALVGGFLMGFGVQMTGGSTNRHGQTGMGLLSILSFITIACIFASGIITGFVMKRYNYINNFVNS